MSQQPPDNETPFKQPMLPDPPYAHAVVVEEPKQENNLGVTGFIVSLVGLLLCGVPSLIGLILSAIALKNKPRGLAITGVIIGLIGTIQLAYFAMMVYPWIQTARKGLTEANEMLDKFELQQSAADVGMKWEDLGRIPTQEEGDEILLGRNDMMNNSLVYETDGSSFSIRSAGVDEILETEDDMLVGPFKDPQNAIVAETDYILEPFGEPKAEADDSDGASQNKPGDLMDN